MDRVACRVTVVEEESVVVEREVAWRGTVEEGVGMAELAEERFDAAVVEGCCMAVVARLCLMRQRMVAGMVVCSLRCCRAAVAVAAVVVGTEPVEAFVVADIVDYKAPAVLGQLRMPVGCNTLGLPSQF